MKRLYISIFLSLCLYSCGGGGGGSSAPTPTPTPTVTPTVTPTPTPTPSCDEACFNANKSEYESLYEYSNQFGLGMSNASSAYARGADGTGMTIGVVDSGLDDSHAEITSSKIQSGSQLNYSDYIPTTRQKRHGTAVSSIAAGNAAEDNSPMHGVAFNAKIFFIAVQLGEAPPDYDPVDLGDSTGAGSPDYSGVDNFYNQVFGIFINNDVDIVNNSFGYTGTINDYTEAQLRNAFPNTIDRIGQSGVIDENKTLFVWSAGNTGQYADQGADYSSPDVFPGMAHLIPELQGHSLAVVSVDDEGVISDFSSRCGVAKDFCIAAPGEGIVLAYATSMSDTGIFDTSDSCVSDNSCYAVGGGTSYAAPFVSGGLALLAEHFGGQLGNTEILQRILLTADKSGIYSDESIYGQGLMDLNAASQPVGMTMIPTSNSLDGLSFLENISSINNFNNISGDAFNRAFQNKSFIVFDSLGAPFSRPLQSSISINLPSLAWISAKQSNAGISIRQVSSQISKSSSLTLGLSYLNYGEHDLTKSLWSKDDRNLRYFSVSGPLSDSISYFIGSGISPSMYLGFQGELLSNGFASTSVHNHPFMTLTDKGSFLGAGFNFNKNIINAFIFKGEDPDMERFLQKKPKTSGLILELKRKFNTSKLSLHSGFLKEPKGFLGNSIEGAFGSLDASDTFFTGFETSKEFNKYYLLGNFFYGKTKTNFEDFGLVTNFDDFSSSSFSVGLFSKNGFTDKDSFGIKVQQPLRVENGGMSFSVPYARTRSREVLFRDEFVDFVPKGREIEFQIMHNASMLGGEISSRLGLVRQSGHRHERKKEFYLSTEFRVNLK